MKKLVHAIMPPLLIELLYSSGLLSHHVKWGGNYTDWKSALNDCLSYNSNEIFEKVTLASREVEQGKAAYERDSVIFNEIQYSWPLLSSLLWVYARTNHINLIDYGGALGSSWRQNKRFLSKLQNIKWTVVEQNRFVEVGKKEFSNDQLNFKENLSDAYTVDCNTILFGNSLSYVEKPWNLLDEVISLKIKHIIIDKTAVQLTTKDRLTKQTVKPPIYSGSYPCWLFSEHKLFNKLNTHYRLIEKWKTDRNMISDAYFLGGLWELKEE